jgi:hypothetical protein
MILRRYLNKSRTPATNKRSKDRFTYIPENFFSIFLQGFIFKNSASVHFNYKYQISMVILSLALKSASKFWYKMVFKKYLNKSIKL